MQWLRLCAPNAGGAGLIPGQGTKIPQASRYGPTPPKLYENHISESIEQVWMARRTNKSILKESNPEYSLEGVMLKLELQYSGHLMQRSDSLEKPLMLGNVEGRRRGWQRMRWLGGITDSMDMFEHTLGDSEGQGSLACCSPKSQTPLSD